MHQDKVRIIILDGQKEGKRQEGVVVKVLERGMPEIVGTYQLNRDFGFVISDNPKFSKDIFIPRKEAVGVKNGDKVIATITDYGSKIRTRKARSKRIWEISVHRVQIFWQSSRASEFQVNFRRKYRSRHREFRITYWMLTEMEDWT